MRSFALLCCLGLGCMPKYGLCEDDEGARELALEQDDPALRMSGSELFARVSGDWQGMLQWHAEGHTAEVAPTRVKFRMVEPAATAMAGGACGESLRLGVDLEVETADTRLKETFAAELSTLDGATAVLRSEIPGDTEFFGTLALNVGDFEITRYEIEIAMTMATGLAEGELDAAMVSRDSILGMSLAYWRAEAL